MVWRLDRLGRALKDLIALVEELENRKIGLRFLQENIDTTTSGGKLIFHLFSTLAELERNLIRKRTQAGLQAARAIGKKGGRLHSIVITATAKSSTSLQSEPTQPFILLVGNSCNSKLSLTTPHTTTEVFSTRNLLKALP